MLRSVLQVQPLHGGRTERTQLERCIVDWRRELGEGAVLSASASEHYGQTCLGVRRNVPVVLRPSDERQVVQLVRTAARHAVPLYPISTGKNWGYGAAAPVLDGCAVVDLSQMNRIVECDAELGLVTVEPGVTQQQLYDYLRARNLPFLVPVTGAGPECSLLGNAIERGYGMTPHVDHFAAVNAMRAVMPSGDIYSSGLAAAGGQQVDRAHKWGVGPYLDGIFAQGAFGIVTQMTLTLAPSPEHLELFVFEIADEAQLGAAVEATRELIRDAGDQLSGINLVNRFRIAAMNPAAAAGRRAPQWLGLGTIYSPKAMLRGTRALVRQRLKPCSRRLLFFSRGRLARLGRLLSLFPKRWVSQPQQLVATLSEVMEMLGGCPKETALKLVYRDRPGLKQQGYDPAADGCGLMWYSPLVPFTATSVQAYVEMVQRTCQQHNFPPAITLTTLSSSCLDSTIPLLFDRTQESRQAAACYDALFSGGADLGFLPYRVGINAMHRFTDTPSTFWDLVHQLKQTIDPNNIIAPGRYAPSTINAG